MCNKFQYKAIINSGNQYNNDNVPEDILLDSKSLFPVEIVLNHFRFSQR